MATEGVIIFNSSEPNVWEPNTPHEIEISITVQYVGAVDVLKETFAARLWIDVFWLPSAEEFKSDSSPTEWDLESNLQTVNAIKLHSFDIITPPKIKDIKGRNMYHGVVQIDATFSSPFNLRSFPFDCQKLHIKIEMGNINNMYYKPAKHINNMLSIETQLCVLDEWDFHDANISFTASDASLSKQGNRYSQCIIQIILPREWESFVFRLGVIIMLLDISILAVYSIGYEDVADRLGFIFTLLLTLVAFQYTISSSLPATSYLTFFDKYFISCITIIFINVFTVSMGPTIIESGFNQFDTICFWLCFISIIGVHVFFFIRAFHARTKAMEMAIDDDKNSNIDEDDDTPENIKISKKNIKYFPNEKDERFCIFKTN